MQTTPAAGVIDLDVPDTPRARRRRADRRPTLAASLLVAAALLPAGDARPAAPAAAVISVRAEHARSVRLDGDVVYLLTDASAESYRLSDGARRWSVSVSDQALLVHADAERVVLAGSASLVGLDGATGAEVWRRNGYAFVPDGDAAASGVALAWAPTTQMRLAGIDIRTGDVRWTLPAPDGGPRVVLAAGGEVQIADVEQDGTLRLRAAGSAAPVYTVRLDLPGSVNRLDVAGGRVLTAVYSHGAMRGFTVFDLATGRPLWRPPDGPDGGMWWCGRTLCSMTGLSTSGLDPDTGRERWRLYGWSLLTPLDDRHLLATRNSADPDRGGLVLDTGTGRVLQTIEGWDVVGTVAWPGVLVARRDATSGGGALVARLDAATGAATPLGHASQWTASARCVASARYLACLHDRLSVWRLPRGIRP
ncbi:PQQ-binding-like beta-propeller repeat protein [Dactylosporangium sp. NPDC051485]|uniref:outer membrane protein assembly factor BamB family protein n=1 Tax=Dactylosporangium sp. NPDC051485 TaxID=3154846 RepID=UPI00344162FD